MKITTRCICSFVNLETHLIVPPCSQHFELLNRVVNNYGLINCNCCAGILQQHDALTQVPYNYTYFTKVLKQPPLPNTLGVRVTPRNVNDIQRLNYINLKNSWELILKNLGENQLSKNTCILVFLFRYTNRFCAHVVFLIIRRCGINQNENGFVIHEIIKKEAEKFLLSNCVAPIKNI